MELLLCFLPAITVVSIYDKHQACEALVVVTPQRADLVTTCRQHRWCRYHWRIPSCNCLFMYEHACRKRTWLQGVRFGLFPWGASRRVHACLLTADIPCNDLHAFCCDGLNIEACRQPGTSSKGTGCLAGTGTSR